MFLISPNSYSPFTAVGQWSRNQRKLCATLEPSIHVRIFRAFDALSTSRPNKMALPSHWTEPQEQPLDKSQYRDSCNCYCAMALFSRITSHGSQRYDEQMNQLVISSLIPSLSWLSMVVFTKHGECLSLLKNRWNMMFPLVDRYEKPTPLLAKTPHQIPLIHTFSTVNPWFWKVVWWPLMVVESHYFHPGNCGQYTHIYILY